MMPTPRRRRSSGAAPLAEEEVLVEHVLSASTRTDSGRLALRSLLQLPKASGTWSRDGPEMVLEAMNVAKGSSQPACALRKEASDPRPLISSLPDTAKRSKDRARTRQKFS